MKNIVTWDSTVFNSPNTTVIVEGSYVNATSGEITSQAFSSPETTAGRSYYAWAVDAGLLRGADGGEEAANITLVIRALAPGSGATAEVYPGPTVAVARRRPRRGEAAPLVPTGAALYVGLPTVLGFCALMLCGVCVWNREARRIGLGNVMSRRRGRVGRRMAARRDRKQALRLADHGLEAGEGVKGRKRETLDSRDGELPPHHQSLRFEDDGWGQDWGQQQDDDDDEEYYYKDHHVSIPGGVARRDSDALGSLAGTPTSEHFPSMQHYEKH